MMDPRLFCFLLFWLILPHSKAMSDTYGPGDSIVGFKTRDQNHAEVIYKAGDAHFILFDTPGLSGTSESPKDPDWFKKNHVLLVVNLSELPGLERKMAWSRMAAKPYRLLVVEDLSVAARFPRQSGKFSVIQLDRQGKIVGIRFAAPGKELKDLIEGNSQWPG